MTKATIRKRVIEYWVAELPNGEAIDISAPLESLVDGKEVEGEVLETDMQHKNEDGSFARSFTIYRTFKRHNP